MVVFATLIYFCWGSVSSLWAITLFGPNTYNRTTGKPNIYTDTFSNCETQSLYKLVIKNGEADGSKRLSSASILLNGVEVLRPHDLNRKVRLVERPVTVQSENTLELRLASRPGGQLTVSIECITNCFEVTIDAPIFNANLNQSTVLVTGTVYSRSEEVGVVVNATSGQVFGLPSQFAVPEVPLNLGLNTLTATATNSCGMQAKNSIQVNVESLTESPVILWTVPSGGVAPVTVRFRALAIPPNPVDSYSWNFTTETASEVSHTYDTPGLYFPQVTITDTKGLTYTATAVVNVLDSTRLNTLLQKKWTKMRDGLGQGNVEQALKYFTRGSQDRYRQIFEAIQDKLGEEAAGLQDIVLVAFRGTTAKYRIQRTMTINGQPTILTYWVYFVQDTDGIWRIKQF
jgi:hypothetical protein